MQWLGISIRVLRCNMRSAATLCGKQHISERKNNTIHLPARSDQVYSRWKHIEIVRYSSSAL